MLEEETDTLIELQNLIDGGKINDAENQLYEIISNKNMTHLEMGLLFYSYLNDCTDDFLEEYNFTREEIESGLMDLMSEYGLSSIMDTFLRK